MKFSVYQVSRKGGRQKNEDRMGYCYTRQSGLFALADGMGGHPEGEVAAQLALQTLSAMFQRDAKPMLDDPAEFLLGAVGAAHHRLIRYATRKGMSDTPRSTVVACVVQGGVAWWAHCGDSRLYLVRAATLLTRTRDHSYSELQDVLAEGIEPAVRVNRNVLFTCLGSPGEPIVDSAGPTVLQPGDRILLCSDGLWGHLEDGFIAAQLADGALAEAVPELVERALRAGGPTCDNVTAIALEWGADARRKEMVSTEDLGAATFQSTLQSGAGAGSADAVDLDEAAIDRAIREINEAIHRSLRRKT